jgi:hypothetical protein
MNDAWNQISDDVKSFEHNGTTKYWPPREGWMTISILPELIGRPWCNAAANMLVCFRPSVIRVSKSAVDNNFVIWRVTVLLNNQNIIKCIYQEVSVGLVGFRNGRDARYYLDGMFDMLDLPQKEFNVFLPPTTMQAHDITGEIGGCDETFGINSSK